jgi:branched-chain amino acid transport system ATP-binding protein
VTPGAPRSPADGRLDVTQRRTLAASLGSHLGDTSADEPVLVFDDVRLSFAGVTAIDGVSFDVRPRELLAIIGPNGAGKTSIFNVLSGVYRPQRGRVTFLGADLLGTAPHEVAARGMARTFQNIELFENLTVIDNLMLGRHHHVRYRWWQAIGWIGTARREEMAHRRVIEDIVEFLEIPQYRKLPVGLLPYGIQKRVELGRA